jgi:uncharacterized membrane protein YbaN (DUF454 family)
MAALQDALFTSSKMWAHSLGSKIISRSLTHFNSCHIAEFCGSRSKPSLSTMWLHYQIYFFTSSRMWAHSVGLQNASKSLTIFIKCHIVEFIDLDLIQPSEPCGCITRCTFYILQDVRASSRMWAHSVGLRNASKSLTNFISSHIIEFCWSRSKPTFKTM